MSNISNMGENYGVISCPGRICLFGEHQDYLGLPVIPMAINRRLQVFYQRKPKKSTVQFSSDLIPFTENIEHSEIGTLSGSPYDYIKAVFKFYRNSTQSKILPTRIRIRSDIPIKSGLSSSAALIVSTVFLVSNIILEKGLKSIQIADVAYQVEHDIMGISCGRMDQSSVAIGGTFHMTTTGKLTLTPLKVPTDSFFVIGNSEVLRHADIPLRRVQEQTLDILGKIGQEDLHNFQESSLTIKKLTKQDQNLLKGILGVRNNTQKALKELKASKVDLSRIGFLLDEQHGFLRNSYQVSHPKIDKMCEIAKDAGALGAKMTGAGFGGCMFALTDSFANASEIRDRLARQGTSYIVQSAEG